MSSALERTAALDMLMGAAEKRAGGPMEKQAIPLIPLALALGSVYSALSGAKAISKGNYLQGATDIGLALIPGTGAIKALKSFGAGRALLGSGVGKAVHGLSNTIGYGAYRLGKPITNFLAPVTAGIGKAIAPVAQGAGRALKGMGLHGPGDWLAQSDPAKWMSRMSAVGKMQVGGMAAATGIGLASNFLGGSGGEQRQNSAGGAGGYSEPFKPTPEQEIKNVAPTPDFTPLPKPEPITPQAYNQQQSQQGE